MDNEVNSRRTSRRKVNHVDNITLYAAMSRMDDGKNIQNTQGYKMLRELSYKMQEEAVEENQSEIE